MSGKLTRALLEAMDPSALGEIASGMRARAAKIEPEESQFPHRLRFPAGGEEWTGQASDALQERSGSVGRTYGQEHARLIDAVGQLGQAESFIADSRSIARQFISGVEAESVVLGLDGLFYPCGEPFTVADDFTVKVKPLPTGYPQQIFDAVQLEAAGFTENIKRLVQQLEDLGDTWAAKIKESLDLSELALNSKGQPFGPYDPSKTAREQAKAIAEGRMDIPSDPKQLHDLWEQLSPGEKGAIYDRHHDIGNHGGIPFDPPDGLGRDHYNRAHLKEITEQKQHELDQLLQNQPEVPIGAGHADEYAKDMAAWQAKCKTLQNELDGYNNVKATLDRSSKDGLPRFLGVVDDKNHASVSIYNPDKAKDIATVVPGTFSELTETRDYDDKSQTMIRSAITASDGQLKDGQLSVTEWLGYDRPTSLTGLDGKPPWAGETDPALHGGPVLSEYQDGIRASHDDAAAGGRSHNTVIGHSYGTTEVGAAATHGNHLDADSVVLLASPGAFAENAHGLNLNPNTEVFVGKSDLDPINVANFGSDIGLTSLSFLGFHDLGNDPADWKDAHQIDAGSSWDHNGYWDATNPAMKNIGRILIGDNSHVTPYPQ